METLKTFDRDTARTVEEIATRAASVTAAHEAYMTAWMADRDAHADLLKHVVDVVRPALRALSSRVLVSGTEGLSTGPTVEIAPWRGVALVSDTGALGEPRRERGADLARGRYGGRTLYLTASDGVFMEVAYGGAWSSVAGEVSRWSSAASMRSAVEVASEWEVAAVIDRIAVVLREQERGNKQERTRAMVARADRLHALATLMRAL